LTAKLSRNTEFFGKMDPLVKVIIGTHTQRTAVAKRGHKNPGWETELSLRRMAEDIIHFEVWDKDIIKGDLVGMGDIAFNQIFVLGNKFNGWIPLKYKGKEAGELLVDVLFIPDAGTNITELLNQSSLQYSQQQQQQQFQQQQTQTQQTSSGQLQQQPITTSQIQPVLVSRPPAEETPRSGQIQNLPEPTFLQSTPTKMNQMQMPVTYSTPYEKVTTTHSTHYGHANCSAFHEQKSNEPNRDFKEIESQLLPKSETQGFGEKKPSFQSNVRGDLGNQGYENVSGLKS
jgi:hypothetical protein